MNLVCPYCKNVTGVGSLAFESTNCRHCEKLVEFGDWLVQIKDFSDIELLRTTVGKEKITNSKYSLLMILTDSILIKSILIKNEKDEGWRE